MVKVAKMTYDTYLHKLDLFVFGSNDAIDISAEEIVNLMDNELHGGSYDLYFKLGKSETVNIGEWEDDHPLNRCDTPLDYYYSLFGQDYDTLIEKVAELEHEQWMAMTKGIVETTGVSEETYCRWKANWKPYSELSEEVKEKDRVWARKVLDLMDIKPRNDEETLK